MVGEEVEARFLVEEIHAEGEVVGELGEESLHLGVERASAQRTHGEHADDLAVDLQRMQCLASQPTRVAIGRRAERGALVDRGNQQRHAGAGDDARGQLAQRGFRRAGEEGMHVAQRQVARGAAEEAFVAGGDEADARAFEAAFRDEQAAGFLEELLAIADARDGGVDAAEHGVHLALLDQAAGGDVQRARRPADAERQHHGGGHAEQRHRRRVAVALGEAAPLEHAAEEEVHRDQRQPQRGAPAGCPPCRR